MAEAILGTAFMDLVFPEKNYLIGKGILPKESIMVVGGISKAGKSVFVMNMGLSLAGGKPFLGFPIRRKIKVLYVQSEIPQQSLHERLKMMLNCEGHITREDMQNFIILNDRTLKFKGEGEIKIRKDIEKHQPEVVICDPMYKFHRMNENYSNEMRDFFDILDRWVQQYHLSIVLVHHFGKPTENSNRSGAQMLRGSSVIFDYGDSYISLTNYKSTDKKYVKATFELRNDADPEPMKLYRNMDNLWYEMNEENGDRSGCSANDIIESLRTFQGPVERSILIADLMDKTGAGERTIIKRITELYNENRIAKVPEGRLIKYEISGQ